MLLKDIPIKRKLMRVFNLICVMVLTISCISFFCYELYVYRKSTLEKLSIIGGIISANSTAALAFDNRDDAKEILMALRSEPHIVKAALYDKDGKLFSTYPVGLDISKFPARPSSQKIRFTDWHFEGFQPVLQDQHQLGFLYLQSDLGVLYGRLKIFGVVAIVAIGLTFLLAFLLSGNLQKNISNPILALAETAKVISEKQDYSVRAAKYGQDELGLLTDAFNRMLSEIQEQHQALSEFNQTLEQKVKDRTYELQALNLELEAFSYSISHDLRAPLRGIIGFTTILEEDYTNQLDAEAKRITGIIKSNTLKMGHLIDDLLTFSRMGRQDIVKTNIHTGQMVKEVVKDLVANSNSNKVDLVIDEVPDIQGDINAIRQVWVNLISNALKYSAKQPQPRIEIGSYRDNGQTVFFVKDNGVGFDEKYKKKLFKVFQRLHSATEFEGTGVGLAIVEKIVAKHGGKVSAEGKVNEGASFYFSLPNN